MFNDLQPEEFQNPHLVAQTITGWNQTVNWLREMDLLRREGLFHAA